MSGVAVASVVSAGVGFYGASKASKASRKGAQDAAGVQQYMYDQTRQDMAPYRRVGVSALDKLASLYGLDSPGQEENSYGRSTNPETTYQYSQSGKVNDYEVVQAFREFLGRRPTDTELKYYTGRERGDQLYYDVVQPGMERMQKNAPQQEFQGGSKTNPGDPYADFYNSPDYKFAFEQGNRAVGQSLAARGLTDSGRAMKELTRFGQGLASQQLGNYTNRLAALAGVGQTATTNLAHIGQNTANQIGGARQDAADARASGYLGAANAVNQGVQQGYGMWSFNRMMDRMG